MRHNFGKIESILFFGAGSVLTRVVGDLLGKKHLFVVTGQRLATSPSHEPTVTMIDFLQQSAVPCITVDDVNTAPEVSSLITPATLGISLGAPWIFKRKIIQMFDGRLINGHGARLPQDRGGGGFSWRILRGSRLGYSAYHLVTTGVDDGPIVKYREYVFPPHCRIPRDFETFAADHMYDLLKDLLAEIDQGQPIEAIPQIEYLSSYWPRLSADIHGFVDWDWYASEIEAFINAFDEPYPGASTLLGSRLVKLRKAYVEQSDGTFHPFQSGIVYRRNPTGLFVAARGGALVIGQVLADGENIAGSVRVGDRFHTPHSYLERARATRVFYTPRGMRLEEL